MNKHDFAIVAVLVAALVGWVFYQKNQAAEFRTRQQEYLAAREAAVTNVPPAASARSLDAPTEVAPVTVAPTEMAISSEPATDVPEEHFLLSNADVKLRLSSKGASIVAAELLGYKEKNEADSADFALDFAKTPILALEGVAGLGANADFRLVESSATNAVFQCASPAGLTLTRRISLMPDFRVKICDSFQNTLTNAVVMPASALHMGTVSATNDTDLSVDSLANAVDGKFDKVNHWSDDGQVAAIIGGKSGGCSGAPSARGLPAQASKSLGTAQEWLALKSRFFVQICSAPGNNGCRIDVVRKPGEGTLELQSIRGALTFNDATIAPNCTLDRNYSLYIGPKKLSALRKFGHDTAEIMDFGVFKWLCVILVPTLNFLYNVFGNYGIAIIILTILVRIIFWPLTHKSTESMKRMREIQPLIKDVQAKFKDNPQKLQQETMRIYRENKVNPMASCLPMLIQIPVFIALFTVLRSAVELRFADFLWISDLSEAENLFAGKLPFIRSLNILPLVMAGTMFLQSKLTPSMGDPAQQRMMLWMMPLMMLFMFYRMPSALVLYWSVSQILAIAQLLWQQRKGAEGAKKDDSKGEQEVLTRQAKRRMAR